MVESDILNRKELSNQVFCCIQIGYFKSVNMFFGKRVATRMVRKYTLRNFFI